MDSPREPPTANRHQPPPTATNRRSRGHETESVSVNGRFCWRYEPFPFMFPLRTALGAPPVYVSSA